MAGNLLTNLISDFGHAINAPVLFNWDTNAARQDAWDGRTDKRSLDSVAARNSGLTNTALSQEVQDNLWNTGQLKATPVNGIDQNAVYDPYNPYGGGGATVDPYAAQRAAQKAQLQSQLGNLDKQQEIGLGNIGNSFNLGANRLDEQNAVAKRNYEQQGQNNQQNYLQTRNGIMQNSRATNNALQRLLGMNGAGFSSAATEQAPYATALQASTDLSGAQRTYGQNQQTLDTNWGDTQRSYKNSMDDLNNQRYQQENSLRSSIAQTRASLLDRLQQADGTTAYQNQINDLMNQITGLGNQYANPVMRTGDVSFNASPLSQYSLGKFGISAPSQDGGAQSSIDPTFQNLITGAQKRDEFGNPIF